jgi:hypothetical protein
LSIKIYGKNESIEWHQTERILMVLFVKFVIPHPPLPPMGRVRAGDKKVDIQNYS